MTFIKKPPKRIINQNKDAPSTMWISTSEQTRRKMCKSSSQKLKKQEKKKKRGNAGGAERSFPNLAPHSEQECDSEGECVSEGGPNVLENMGSHPNSQFTAFRQKEKSGEGWNRPGTACSGKCRPE